MLGLALVIIGVVVGVIHYHTGRFEEEGREPWWTKLLAWQESLIIAVALIAISQVLVIFPFDQYIPAVAIWGLLFTVGGLMSLFAFFTFLETWDTRSHR